jgi:hypothetical protein
MACRRASLSLAAGLLALLWMPRAAAPAATIPLPPDAAKVARDFLTAFCSNDRDAIQVMIPRDLAALYGPSPFARMPSLLKPRADGRVGAVDFQGQMVDPGLPTKGTIILRCLEQGGTKVWQVRQIYWYEKLPPEANLPDESPTEADRKQEPKLREAVKDLIHYWLAGDYCEVDGRVFHWWQVDRRPPKWVRMTGVGLDAKATNLGGIRVDFTVRLKVLRLLPKSVSGTLWIVQEQGVWRVRPLTLAFFF